MKLDIELENYIKVFEELDDFDENVQRNIIESIYFLIDNKNKAFANHLRSSLEIFVKTLFVKHFNDTNKRKTLHLYIEDIKKYDIEFNSLIYEHAMKIKNITNSGSHGEEVSRLNCIECLNLFINIINNYFKYFRGVENLIDIPNSIDYSKRILELTLNFSIKLYEKILIWPFENLILAPNINHDLSRSCSNFFNKKRSKKKMEVIEDLADTIALPRVILGTPLAIYNNGFFSFKGFGVYSSFIIGNNGKCLQTSSMKSFEIHNNNLLINDLSICENFENEKFDDLIKINSLDLLQDYFSSIINLNNSLKE